MHRQQNLELYEHYEGFYIIISISFNINNISINNYINI